VNLLGQVKDIWRKPYVQPYLLIGGLTGPPYRYLGCYDDLIGRYNGGDRTMPQNLDNWRTGVGIDECAAAARSRGFPVFTLQWKGQCFFGSMPDVARLQATQRFSDDKCNNLPCPTSAASCPGRIHKTFVLIGTCTPSHSACSKHLCR
jgi:hypothetical protein